MLTISLDKRCKSYFIVSGPEISTIGHSTGEWLQFQKGTSYGKKVLRIGSNPYSLKELVQLLNENDISYEMEQDVLAIQEKGKRFPNPSVFVH